MNRRSFLGILGLGAVASVAINEAAKGEQLVTNIVPPIVRRAAEMNGRLITIVNPDGTRKRIPMRYEGQWTLNAPYRAQRQALERMSGDRWI